MTQHRSASIFGHGSGAAEAAADSSTATVMPSSLVRYGTSMSIATPSAVFQFHRDRVARERSAHRHVEHRRPRSQRADVTVVLQRAAHRDTQLPKATTTRPFDHQHERCEILVRQSGELVKPQWAYPADSPCAARRVASDQPASVRHRDRRKRDRERRLNFSTSTAVDDLRPQGAHPDEGRGRQHIAPLLDGPNKDVRKYVERAVEKLPD
jgi:hypothetical protein